MWGKRPIFKVLCLVLVLGNVYRNTSSAKGPKNNSSTCIFPMKYVIPQSLKNLPLAHWLSRKHIGYRSKSEILALTIGVFASHLRAKFAKEHMSSDSSAPRDCEVSHVRVASCFVMYIYIYNIYIPGTQLTSMFEGQPSKTRPFSIKTRVIWLLSIPDFIG